MQTMDFRPGALRPMLDGAVAAMKNGNVVERIWSRDFTVWGESDAEIVNRLGWLDIHARMAEEAQALNRWARDIREAGFAQAVLIGMGGSSLAPEMFERCFAGAGFELRILDTTDPVQIRELDTALDLRHTLFIVATKSGGTVETLSGFQHFHRRLTEQGTGRPAGQHCVAITDPGSTLIALAEEHGFRRVFLNDPDIGGRYSALSHFGLVPLSLLGMDVAAFLAPVHAAARAARRDSMSNDSAKLGLLMAECARVGRDKLTLILPPALASLGDWVEQLIAESLGKSGQGVVPVLGESPADLSSFGEDRLCVAVTLEAADDASRAAVRRMADACAAAGHPTVVMSIGERAELAGHLFQWEFATAVAGYGMGVNPFDQPDVESAKVAARGFLAEFERTGTLPAADDVEATAAVAAFLRQVRPGDYVALQAYLPRNENGIRALSRLGARIRRHVQAPVTIGFGPRFLHSTGQLHKGGGRNGVFLQLIRRHGPEEDVAIPSAGQTTTSFGTLQRAQAMGDASALRTAGQRTLTLDVTELTMEELAELAL